MSKLTIFVFVMALLLSACSTKQLQVVSPTSGEVKAALEQPSPERKISALKAMRASAKPESRVQNLQAAITLLSLDVEVGGPGSKSLFHQESQDLKEMMVGVPVHKVHQDIAVILYLAGHDSAGALGAAARKAVDKLCAHDDRLAAGMGSLESQTEFAADRAFASSCRFYIEGDQEASVVALSEGLKMSLASRKMLALNGVKPSLRAGFEIFLDRFKRQTGISVEDSIKRLSN